MAVSAIPVDEMIGSTWPDELARVVFVDAYGNLMIGLDSRMIGVDRQFHVSGQTLCHAETFCRVPAGQLFW